MASAPRDAVPASTAAYPKSWPVWWRVCMLASLSWFVMMGQVMSASVPPMLGSIIQDFHVSPTEASRLACWAILALGFGNVWAVPMVAHIGVRYTMILGLTVFTVCFFWQAAAQTYGSLIAARVVGGLGGGVVESMGPMIVVMLFPQEYIGRAMSVYTLALGAGTVFGPLFAGYMIEGFGSWRYPQYLFGAMSVLNLVSSLVMFPEPLANIRIIGEPPLPAVSSARSQSHELELVGSKDAMTSQEQEFGPNIVPAEEYPPTSWTIIWSRRSFFSRFVYRHPPPGWLVTLFTPYRLLATPAVLITVLIFGVSISSNIAVSTLVSLTFSLPPLLWSTGLVGLFNTSVLVGLCAGIPIGGLMADKLVSRFSRRNGYHKPEASLPLLVPLAISTPISIALVGYGLAKQWHWATIGVLWALINVNLTGGCTILISYATNIYPEKAIDIGVVVNVLKNAIGAGISLGLVDWWLKSGWHVFLALALIEVAIFLSVVPMWFYGAKITGVTRS
ncbi:major facilitator superfamily transporter [Colletotrichum navitas]|uniref:Major facilitator superfamily transporter n=1 Tax=Colletotrichum navitas TaxID=681940 RepID=A0AAD8UXR3_9PEZI|nr:major facilitator superfamily transporter [Colletotrichum navitas]KAK1569461.1 major facilitator superfamily transporter [Colletotrichum navitas]